MVIESIGVNKTLADARFSKPAPASSTPVAAVGSRPIVAAAAPATVTRK
jgi:hypothetical protein